MKYWVYINEKVDGPFDEEKLVTISGFTPETLVCSEEAASSGRQDWVKASTVFDFEPEPAAQPAADQAAANASAALLLEKLETLTREISTLHTKLDSVDNHISSMESQVSTMENHMSTMEKKMVSVPPPAPQPVPVPAPQPMPAVQPMPEPQPVAEKPAENTPAEQPAETQETPAETQAEQPALEEKNPPVSVVDEPINEKMDVEDELVIRSALDSLYNAKLIAEQEEDEKENTFQDLLTPQEAKKLEPKVDEKTVEIPAEEPAAQPEESAAKEEPSVQEESSEDEKEKDALLAELTSPGINNDVLDQLIQEKEEEKQAQERQSLEPDLQEALPEEQEQQEELPAVGEFTLQEDKVMDLTLPPEEEPDNSSNDGLMDLSAATKRQQEQVAAEAKPLEVREEPLPPLSSEAEPKQIIKPEFSPMDGNFGAPAFEEEQPSENTLQELVPGASMKAPSDQLVSAEDLQNAYSTRVSSPTDGLVAPLDTDIPPAPTVETSVASENVSNPNDLTEVELKAGSTYLISDFVPPAQADGEPVAADQTSSQIAPTVMDKTAEVQDMLADSEEKEGTQSIQPIAEETEQRTTKRGASFDIKTVPMVAEPADSERLQVEGLDDVNTQHDVQLSAGKTSGATKAVITALIAIAVLIIAYIAMAFMNLIPSQYNVLASKEKPKPAAQSSEMLPEPEEVQEVAQPAEENADSMLIEVEQYMLPNGKTLKEHIEATHPAIDASLITWEITNAVEPDNYSVLVKVPPEDPQSFKTSYRFNYNAVTRTLDPTISDAKNLLDAASALPATQVTSLPAAN